MGERREVRCGDAVPAVLDQVQVLDEEIALARALTQQGAHLVERGRVHLPPPLGVATGCAPSGAGMAATVR